MLDQVKTVRTFFFISALMAATLLVGQTMAAEPRVSEATETCLSCHTAATPGIVADWKKSRHARVSPAEALKKDRASRRVSAENIPVTLAGSVVGCAECHTLTPAAHQDNFDHEGEQVHVVVTPGDCAVCHPEEAGQYERNKMAWAQKNLADNPLYNDLIQVVVGVYSVKSGTPALQPPGAKDQADSCYACHGTVVKATGTVVRETDQGDLEFPILDGWPNQGVGRVNPDGSRGSCASCHTRHQFSIKTARQPYTCSQCHKGPDVPAYKVYSVSKHGNIFSTHQGEWDFEAMPWTVGRDFTAPTCAVCHVSQIVDSEGRTLAERTHRMNDRLPWRLFGLVYAHPQPKSPDTTVIRNKAGLPLPTELTGQPVVEFLIDEEEQARRTEKLQKVCLSCHGHGWVEGHWALWENTIRTANAQTLAATRLILKAWDRGAVQGPAAGDSPFNEALERKWVEQWLFYANSTRLASAMDGTDYGVFAEGRWHMSKNLMEMSDWLNLHLKAKE